MSEEQNATSAEQPTFVPADDAAHLLVVDDDKRLRELLSRYLVREGYRVTAAGDAAEARRHLSNLDFDLIVLDVMMPGENGLDFARSLRETSQVPILMLTARAETSDRVQGLETGVDDYLTKPFEAKELSLRIGSILRRVVPKPLNQPTLVRFGPFVFHCERGELRHGEDVVRLTERERYMLQLLAKTPGEPVARELLAGSAAAANERTIDVQINRLRRKIERDPANPIYLQTARGAGYRLLPER
ncbi:response regulator [Methylocella sp. CPCC 101449]|jgi:two-component system phosphate regulon response regulator OmpR|uniref:response regulator n=1 Tax=Methylocella sp. CPCC 101449 TaxID=2987531 RepID=UPI0028915FF1|nr:response regulator [Methylocella sp. CPCC 101449]MDT2023429.1 response regulator [Methylocella sp. CPCC 101449]HEV2574033.1 response regulator [Beijerinckiaceae bacterium]